MTRIADGNAELRELAAGTHDGGVVRRLLPVALVLEGYSRAGAARLDGMHRQTLHDWAHRYNAVPAVDARQFCVSDFALAIAARLAAIDGDSAERDWPYWRTGCGAEPWLVQQLVDALNE